METKSINAEGKGLTDKELKEAHDAIEVFGVSQKLVLFRKNDGLVLLIKNANTEKWELPGGAVDKGEDLSEALLREVREEVGDMVQYSSIGFVSSARVKYVVLKKEFPVLLLGYVGLFEAGEIILSREHTEYAWKSIQDVSSMEEGLLALKTREFILFAAERLKEREYLNDTKRMYADFENYKRRQEERMKELSAMCVEGVALDMIPVLDNFRAAGAHVPEEEKTKAWMTGITYIGKQLEDALASHGLVAYEAKEGEMFDPYLHEAVSHDEQGGEDGKIVKALQPGYKMGTKVIRPAKVIVA